MPTGPYGERVSVRVPYTYPSVCVCLRNDVIFVAGNGGAWGVVVYVCSLNKEAGGHAQ